MANTYTQIYIHIVYAVKWRESLIAKQWKERLQKYTTGIVQNQGHKLLAINTMPDHAHIFIGMRPDVALSDLVRDMKRDSTNFVNDELRPGGRFAWQEGFGAFSYSRSQIDSVVRYILNQEKHHRQRTFREEYKSILKEFDVDTGLRNKGALIFGQLNPRSNRCFLSFRSIEWIQLVVELLRSSRFSLSSYLQSFSS
ncbi:MAG: transposase [Bacteroidetes bacterium]|nr:transposase [Bacteroidota bacterium]